MQGNSWHESSWRKFEATGHFPKPPEPNRNALAKLASLKFQLTYEQVGNTLVSIDTQIESKVPEQTRDFRHSTNDVMLNHTV